MLNFDDTIVAIATANGIGSISIVRLSGKNSLNLALKLSNKTTLTPRYATLSKLYDTNNSLIDEAILIYFKAPFSFSGEDIVEFQCHGGIAITNIILNELITLGARLAKPGEFSKRAFLNGKIDLTKAEAIAQIINSKSQDAVRILAKQLDGELVNFVQNIKKDLLFMLAYSEVSIDYAQEDLPKDIYNQIKSKLLSIKLLLEKTLKASEQRIGLIEGFKVAIIGKPNVGKSSLLNNMLNKNRAIVIWVHCS
jgi:tRNA modification GTPase